MHAGVLVGNIQEPNETHEVKVLRKLITFIFDGKTMLFNWVQLLNVLPKSYVDVAVPVAGKYTFCKL